MSCFTISVLEPSEKIIEVQSTAGTNISTTTLVNYTSPHIELVECVAQLPSDFTDRIFATISGDIIASTGMNILYSNNTLYLNSIINAGSGISLTHNSGIYTISINDSQLSENYSLIGHQHVISDIDSLQLFLDSKQPSGIYASGIHNHGNISSDGSIGSSSNKFVITGESGVLTTSNMLDIDNTFLTIKDPNSGQPAFISLYNNDGGDGSVGIDLYSYDNGLKLRIISNDDTDDNIILSNNYPLGILSADNTVNISAASGTNIIGGPSTYVFKVNDSGVYINNSPVSVSGHIHTASDINSEGGDGWVLMSDGDGNAAWSPYADASRGFADQDVSILNVSANPYAPSFTWGSGYASKFLDSLNFNSAVSGLIPTSNFTSLSGISGIIVTNSGTNYFVGLNDPTIQLTDITDLSSNARTFLLTSSSDNLRNLISDETGSGVLVFNNSPAFSGIPTAPTAPSGTNSNQIANTSFVRTEISNLVNSAPSTLDTLNELAAALGNDPNFATTIASGLGSKAPLVHSHIISDVIDLQTALDGKQASGHYSLVGHSHTASNITNFNSSVSGLLPSISGSAYTVVSFANNIYTINVTGLQPSGNYANSSHTHTSSDIINFNSGVSGLVDGVYARLNGASFIGNISAPSGTFTNNVFASGFVRTNGTSSQFLKADGSVDSNSYYLNNNPSGYTTNLGTVTNVSSLTIGTSGNDVSSSVSNSSTTPAITLNIPSASATNRGVLNSTDWITFNNKQPSGNYANVTHSHIISDVSNLQNVLDSKQASGNYSLAGHTHTASEISDFNSSVSGLLPVSLSQTSAVYEFTRSSKPATATGSNGAYSWPLPAGAKVVEIACLGGGGGGGSGRRGATTETRFGGGGGGGGTAMIATINASAITTALTVTVGAGSVGGASRTTDNTDGASGTGGGTSSVSFNGSSWLWGIGGGPGGGGTTTAGAAGSTDSVSARTYTPTNGGAASATGTGGSPGAASAFAGTGGAAGGSINATNTIFSPGVYRQGTGTSPYFLAVPVNASTGSAGAASTTGNATAGPNAPTYGHGGNGGGAATNGVGNSGAGGNGGEGYIRITVWF